MSEYSRELKFTCYCITWKLWSRSIIPHFITARCDFSLSFHPLWLLIALQNNIQLLSFTCVSEPVCMDISVWSRSYVAPSPLALGTFFFLSFYPFFFLFFFKGILFFQTRGIKDRGEAACILLGWSSLPEPGTEPRLSVVSHWATIQNVNWSAELSEIQAF